MQNLSLTTNASLASKESRYIAALIDYTLFIALVYFLSVEYGTITGPTSTEFFHVSFTGWPAIFLLVGWLFLPTIEGIFGQSIGKRILGIHVTDLSGKKITWKQAMIRHLFDCIDVLPFMGILGLLVASKSPDRQRIGDIVAGTIVTKN